MRGERVLNLGCAMLSLALVWALYGCSRHAPSSNSTASMPTSSAPIPESTASASLAPKDTEGPPPQNLACVPPITGPLTGELGLVVHRRDLKRELARLLLRLLPVCSWSRGHIETTVPPGPATPLASGYRADSPLHAALTRLMTSCLECTASFL